MNSFGQSFRVSIFGESHSEIIGVTLDGVPAGLPIGEEDFTADILRRKTGYKGTSPRIESDAPRIISGVKDSLATGSPLTILFENKNVRSTDYSRFEKQPRPGHADYTAIAKWDSRADLRGGGHFSGRLTLPLTAAGVVAKKIVEGMDISANLVSVGGCQDSSKWESLLDAAISEGDSLGAILECRVQGIPAGVGEPFWNSVESLISHAIFSIPGVRGIEFGDGFAAAGMKGSEHNDPFGPAGPLKNGSGGINGGISNGAPIVFRVAFKPTSSISKTQQTLNLESGQIEDLTITGRHDVCFALRCPVIVEAMTAIVLADLVKA